MYGNLKQKITTKRYKQKKANNSKTTNRKKFKLRMKLNHNINIIKEACIFEKFK